VTEAMPELVSSKATVFLDVMLYRIAVIIIIIIIIIAPGLLSPEYGIGSFFGKDGNCIPADITSY
jgi:hypothetical protein